MNSQITKLCSIANEIDSKGYHKLASELDEAVKGLIIQAGAPVDEATLSEGFARGWEAAEEGLMRMQKAFELFARSHRGAPPEAMAKARKCMSAYRRMHEQLQYRRSEMDEVLEAAAQAPENPTSEEMSAPLASDVSVPAVPAV